MTIKIFKINGMHCTSCAMLIDGDLEDISGVKKARTNYAKQVTEVEYDETKVDEEKLLAAIRKTGYEVTP